uniref:TRAP transporter small permease n=1 Tax=Marinobacterium profundum TaxID=1714300 RepID=UPI0008368009|nr:TRAP transporter small permease [Marinobacterium profundum]
MKKVIHCLDEYFEPSLIVLSVSLMTILVFAEILLRPFNMNLPWSGEMARYLFVWAIYLGISYAVRGDRHIRVTLLIDLLPARGKAFFMMLADIIFALYSTLVVYYGYRVCIRSLELGQIAPALEVPIAVLYASVVVSSALCLIRLLPNIRAQAHLWLMVKPKNIEIEQKTSTP